MGEKLKHLRRIEIEPASNGGHTVTHHFHPTSSRNGAVTTHHDPQSHVFGADQGHDLLAHLANELKLREPQDQEPEGEPEQEA